MESVLFGPAQLGVKYGTSRTRLSIACRIYQVGVSPRAAAASAGVAGGVHAATGGAGESAAPGQPHPGPAAACSATRGLQGQDEAAGRRGRTA